MTSAIEAQIERFAPGFGQLVLDRRTVTAARMADGTCGVHGARTVLGDRIGGPPSFGR